jgi:DNA-directed RNA polymerase subunit RPC12/RpoP
VKLIETKCPNCGSSVKVDNKKKKIKCDYCETSFLLDDDTIEVKHLRAGEISEEQEFINAETYLNKLKKYDDAYEIYLSLSKRYVDNSEVWIGLLRCLTKDFTYKFGGKDFKKKYQTYWNSFCAIASEEEIAEYRDKYNNYVDKVRVTLVRDENIIPKKVTDNNMLLEGPLYLMIVFFGGMFGVHKFIKHEYTMGVIYLFTGGLFGIGWFLDLILAIIHMGKR